MKKRTSEGAFASESNSKRMWREPKYGFSWDAAARDSL